MDERQAATRAALGIPDPKPAKDPDAPHLLVVDSGVLDDDTGEVDVEDAVGVQHTDRCGHDGFGGPDCLLGYLEQEDGLHFLHVDNPDEDGTKLVPGVYWVKAWMSRDYWGEWDAGIDLMYPEEAQP